MWQALTLELRRAFAYRTEFWLRFLGLLAAQVVIAYYLWRAVYAQSGTTMIGGYSFRGMVLYYVLVPLVENVSRPTDRSLIAAEIYSGTLTRYLVYPMPFFPYKYATTLATTVVAGTQLVLLLAVFGMAGVFPAEFAVTPASVAMGLVAGVAASVLNFVLVALVEMAAFWADNVWSLNVMLAFVVRLLGGAMLPLALFPGAVQGILALTPFPYLVSFPVLALAGRIDLAEWLRGLGVLSGWALVVAGLLAVVWRRGQRTYTGVGI